MKNIQMKLLKSRLRAFTLLESLVTLGVVSFLACSLVGGVASGFRTVEERLFLLEFERLYKTSQELAIASQQDIQLSIQSGILSNGYQEVLLPDSIFCSQFPTLLFRQNGGNSSLAKIQFQLTDKTVTYQLYMGSGRYKRTEN